ncbi:MAG: adenylate cyclase, partial [Erysipelotrichia bacterium]|nr:adenylate cyclase [Erysipelotrichia bacterium]
LVFCATAATIVSGAMAERTKFISYCVYSVMISLLVYPIEAHWIWGGGWLAQIGFHDFAGSCAIHMVGGIAAIIGAKLLGPRIGKFNKDGSPNGILGHNITIGALGVFILWFGWYGFNGAAATNGLQLATIFATTTVAPALATVTVMIITWIQHGKPDVAMSLNGSLAGLVAITAGCDAVNVFGASIIGILSGFVVVFVVWLLDYKLKIDDPVGAVAVHGGCGILGTICVGLFACGTDTMPEALGLFYGGGTDFLVTQLIGVGSVALWTAVTMTIVFVVIKATIGLRVTQEEEIVGLDKLEHGLDSSYAGFAMETEFSGGATFPSTTGNVASVTLDEAIPTKVVKTDGKMSKVVIITKAERFDALKVAMDEIGIMGMTVTKVLGCGVQKGQPSYYRGAKVDMELLPKLKAEIVVSKVPVQKVVDAARKVLYTGNIGDGEIFVYDVENVVRISSGAQGIDALQYEDK